MRLAVTTASTTTPECETRAQEIADELGVSCVPRRDRTWEETADIANAERLLIVERRELRLFDRATGTTYAYHPNLLPVRAASLLRGDPDLFLRALNLSAGDAVLDCTLGFGADATLAAFVVGPAGRVVGLESVPELALVSRYGMQTRRANTTPAVLDAMRRVQVVSAHSLDYLKHCAAGSFDTVYFDPFFGERLSGSECSVSPLALFGCTEPLSADTVQEARRVARTQVIVKTPKRDPLPPQLAEDVQDSVTTHKSRVAFHRFAPLDT